jgi:SAM-dependent methyltransferase
MYSRDYYSAFVGGATRSADIVLPLVRAMIPVHSVADFGCGPGAWLAAWTRLGVTDIAGCDGPYVASDSLLIDPARFVARDLSAPVRLGRRFDLVQSLEVAEHLPAAAAATFVETLTAHGAVVLFSAAAPGQGGEHHVNEQPLGYWRGLFAARGFELADPLRPHLRGDRRVEPWYRYNVVVFVGREGVDELSPALRASMVPPAARPPDYVPPGLRMIRRFLRHLPEPVVTPVARQVRRWRRPVDT